MVEVRFVFDNHKVGASPLRDAPLSICKYKYVTHHFLSDIITILAV